MGLTGRLRTEGQRFPKVAVAFFLLGKLYSGGTFVSHSGTRQRSRAGVPTMRIGI